MAVDFLSSEDADEEHLIYLKSDNIEFIPYDNANEVVNELFLNQSVLETSIRGSDFFSI